MLGGSITLSPVELDNLYEKYRQNKMGYVETFVSAETNAITIRIREDEVF